ncbi:MAG: TraR/DksA family transcriptional regulator [Chitinophagaceae bacterium]|nr:TraR/DksA family transcriptional regulator [Chitinophagaceae bacterium]
MATKKKAAKPAKKNTPVKKVAPAKKPAVKSSKAAKPAPKKATKAAPTSQVKKSAEKIPVKKAENKPVAKSAPAVSHKPAAKAAPAPAPPKKAIKQPEVKQPEVKQPAAPKKEEKAPEVKVVEMKKPGLINIPPPKKPAPPVKPVKVVMPEIKTKTVRKYEPEFTKSVLDQPEAIPSVPTMRYSDAELQEFRELIQKKLDQAKKELTYLQGLITRKDEMGGDENENRYMTMEDGSMSMEREQLAQMASRQINYIDHLEKAIMRIENRTYGICRVTGKLIDKARLRAVPHATLSIEAKQMMNK